MDNLGKKALKAGAWYTICTFVLKAMSFLTMPIFTRWMSPSEIGQYANLASWISILSGPVTLELYSSVNLARFKYDGTSLYSYMSSITIAGCFFTAIIYIGATYQIDRVTQWLGITPWMFHTMFIYFLVNPAILILHAKFRLTLQYRQTIVTSLLPAIISTLLSLAAVILFTNDKLYARITAYYGVWAVFGAVILGYILQKGRTVCWQHIKFAIPISVPLIVHTLANTILSTSDRVMIQHMCGSESTAYYSIAYSSAMVVAVLWSAINQAWAPWCYEMMHQKKEKNINKVAKPILLIFSTGVLVVVLIAPELLYVMGGKAYLQAVYVIPPVLIGYIAQMLYTLYVNIESYNKKQLQIMCGTLIAAVINVILNLICIPRFGYIAAAYTTLVGYIALLFLHYTFVRKMRLHYIYDMKFNILLLTITLLLGILISLLYPYAFLRFLIFLMFIVFWGIILWKHRVELIQGIKDKDILVILKVLHLIKGENL